MGPATVTNYNRRTAEPWPGHHVQEGSSLLIHHVSTFAFIINTIRLSLHSQGCPTPSSASSWSSLPEGFSIVSIGTSHPVRLQHLCRHGAGASCVADATTASCGHPGLVHENAPGHWQVVLDNSLQMMCKHMPLDEPNHHPAPASIPAQQGRLRPNMCPRPVRHVAAPQLLYGVSPCHGQAQRATCC